MDKRARKVTQLGVYSTMKAQSEEICDAIINQLLLGLLLTCTIL